MSKITSLRMPIAALLAVSGFMLAVPASAQMVASEGWAAATGPGALEGSGFLVLRNTGDEEHKLLRVTSPISETVGLYWFNTDAQGALRKWPMHGIELEPGESLRLEPRGRQLVFKGLKAPLEVGQQIPVKLLFEYAGEVTVMLEVRPAPAP